MVIRPYFDTAITDAGLESKAVMDAYSTLFAHIKTNTLENLKQLDGLNLELDQIKNHRGFESLKKVALKYNVLVGFRFFCDILLPERQVSRALSSYVQTLKNASQASQ